MGYCEDHNQELHCVGVDDVGDMVIMCGAGCRFVKKWELNQEEVKESNKHG